MAARSSTKRSAKERKSDPAVSYNDFKEYEGQQYTGMKIGRSHKWYYDQGEWKEKKITPDLWQISYAVTKRRAGRAPEGSGVPVGTEYHWNANDYTTSMTGLKFKIAHKRAGRETWSATPRTQRKRMIAFLKRVLADLETQGDREAAQPPARNTSSARARATRTPRATRKRATKRRSRSARTSA